MSLCLPSRAARKQTYDKHENQLSVWQPVKRKWLTLPQAGVWTAWFFTVRSLGVFAWLF